MKISSDWIIAYLRQFGYAESIRNNVLGSKIKGLLSAMGCKQVPDHELVGTLVKRAVGKIISPYGLPRDSYHYEIDVGQLPELFRGLEKELGEQIT